MWDLEPNQSILRKVLHQRFGGQQQGGISPSARTPTYLSFTTPRRVSSMATTTTGRRMAASITRAKGNAATRR